MYIRKDDVFHLIGWSSAGSLIRLVARIVTKDGSQDISINLNCASDRSGREVTLRSGYEGELQYAEVILVAPTTRRGQTYVETYLMSSHIMDLCQGYVFTGKSIYWSEGAAINENSIDGSGYLRSVSLTPAVGVEITVTCPTGARWRVKAMQITFTCAVAVADRIINLIFRDATGAPFYQLTPQVVQTSGQVKLYSLGRGLGFEEIAFNLANTLIMNIGLPEIDLFQGWAFGTTTTSKNAGDQYAIVYTVEEWIEL